MRCLLLSLVLGLGALGLSLATPSPVRADQDGGANITSDTVPVRYFGRGYYGRGRGFYRGYGNYRGYYPYGGYGGYGGYRSFYYPRYYGGYYPWGGYYRPYSSFYYGPGYSW